MCIPILDYCTLVSNTRKSQMAGSKIAPDQSVFMHKLWLVL